MTVDQRIALKSYRYLFETKPCKDDGYKRANEIVPFATDLYSRKEYTPEDSHLRVVWKKQLRELIRYEREDIKERLHGSTN